jgi:hypothetical protein
MAKNPPVKQQQFDREPSQPQSPPDRPDYEAGYLGDVADDWRRGAGESAEQKPGFDSSGRKPWRGVP